MARHLKKTTTLKRGRKNTTSRRLKRKTASKRRARGGAEPDEEEMLLYKETQENLKKANKFRKELESKVILENGEERVLTVEANMRIRLEKLGMNKEYIEKKCEIFTKQ